MQNAAGLREGLHIVERLDCDRWRVTLHHDFTCTASSQQRVSSHACSWSQLAVCAVIVHEFHVFGMLVEPGAPGCHVHLPKSRAAGAGGGSVF